MEKSNSFAYYLNKYLAIHLPGERGLATNSILTYRDTFSIFLEFLKYEKQLRPEQLQMSFLTQELIIEFATWLENIRKCSIATRNQRIGNIRTFCKWLAYENPEFLILAAGMERLRLKKAPKLVVNYLSVDALKCLLDQPDSSTKSGLRDLALLALTYDTGARVSEIIGIKFSDIRFSAPPTIRLFGKGDKSRIVPLLPQTFSYLEAYIERWGLNVSQMQHCYVFTNRSGKNYTRAGIKYILDKYIASAQTSFPSLMPKTASPHSLRHSKAMHLLQAGVNIVYIRDILGHSNLNTTERYARADTKMKREALTKAEITMPIQPLLIPEKPLEVLKHGIEVDMENWLKSIAKP